MSDPDIRHVRAAAYGILEYADTHQAEIQRNWQVTAEEVMAARDMLKAMLDGGRL